VRDAENQQNDPDPQNEALGLVVHGEVDRGDQRQHTKRAEVEEH
jgi:hypothetical protein